MSDEEKEGYVLKKKKRRGERKKGFDDEPLILLFFACCFIYASFISLLSEAEVITAYETLPSHTINTAD